MKISVPIIVSLALMGCSAAPVVQWVDQAPAGCESKGKVEVSAFESTPKHSYVEQIKMDAAKKGGNTVTCCTYTNFGDSAAEEYAVAENRETGKTEHIFTVVGEALECPAGAESLSQR